MKLNEIYTIWQAIKVGDNINATGRFEISIKFSGFSIKYFFLYNLLFKSANTVLTN